MKHNDFALKIYDAAIAYHDKQPWLAEVEDAFNGLKKEDFREAIQLMFKTLEKAKKK